ncbi:hypothetical protein C7I87_29180 [Mesorhizobium sp. SARCC-RB16n]|nr:hypothetical protein C7I87_29180 [Mesorhizobium sp. SARCC-RB16n]
MSARQYPAAAFGMIQPQNVASDSLQCQSTVWRGAAHAAKGSIAATEVRIRFRRSIIVVSRCAGQQCSQAPLASS